MSHVNIHPRFLERIKGIGEDREQDIMDKHVRVYCQLRKAANRLHRMSHGNVGDNPFADIRLDGKRAENLCANAARVMRQQALGDDASRADLLDIYADLERLSESINQALASSKAS